MDARSPSASREQQPERDLLCLSKPPCNTLAAVFDGILEALKKGEEVRLSSFGSFSTVERGEREGRNPRTGETIRIAASKAAKFNPAKTVRDALNG